MQLKALKLLGSSDLHTYASEREIWNPTINMFWQRENNQISCADYFSFLRSLFSRENLTQTEVATRLCSTFGIHAGETRRRVYDTFVAAVPDEDLWVFNYMAYGGMGGSDRPDVMFYTGSVRQLNNAGAAYISYTDAYETAPYAYTTQEFATWLRNGPVKRVKDSYGKMFTHPDWAARPMARDNYPGYSYWMGITHNFVLGGKIFTLNGRSASTSQVHDAIAADPENVGLVIEGSPSQSWTLKVQARITRTNKTALHTIFPYSTNILSMLDYPIKAKGEFNPVLYGVELEVSTDYNVREIIDATDLPFMAAKQDSSITGTKRHAMELVTVPMSLKAHKQQWAKWFSKLDYDKFDTTKSTNNGMHVHIGREFFESAAHKRNFLWFINNPSNFDFFLALSERNQQGLQMYSKMAPMLKNKSESYRKIDTLVARDRNQATNVQKSPTIEVRLFRGIVSYASVLKNLEAVDAILHYTRTLSIKDAGSLTQFLSWVQSTSPNKYTVLKKFLAMTNMADIVLGAQIKDIIFTEDSPDKIVNLLKSSGLMITNAHVTYLNRNRKKRTYILDKKTGDLVLVQSDKGKVAALDRTLEQRYVNAA